MVSVDVKKYLNLKFDEKCGELVCHADHVMCVCPR